MQALIKILTILLELIEASMRKREVVKRDEEIKAIRKDPAGEFVSEFCGVRERTTQAGMPGDQARVGIDEH